MGDAQGRIVFVYTRCAPGNERIFNSRAPLYLAGVHPKRLCIFRNTERILFPNKGYPLGNFGVTHVGDNETLVVTTEWPRIEFTKPIVDAGNDILLAFFEWKRTSIPSR